MSITHFVSTYGYLAVFVGTLFEGESILIAAGFAAHQGLLNWATVVAIATFGGVLGDQLAFHIGRWKGASLLKRFPTLARHAPKVHGLLERHDIFFILSVRFLYGLRIAGPLIMGSSQVKPLRFALLNSAGAIVWATLVSGAGYIFGAALESAFAEIKQYEHVLLLLILVAGLVVWLWQRKRA